MATRATARQAIDLLKIYQLRRENTLVCEQVQSLRETVIDLADAHKTLQKSSEKVIAETDLARISITTQRQEVAQLVSAVRTLEERQTTFSAQISGRQEQIEVASKDVVASYHDLKTTMLQVKSDHDADLQSAEQRHLALIERLDDIQACLRMRADDEQLDSLKQHLNDNGSRSHMYREGSVITIDGHVENVELPSSLDPAGDRLAIVAGPASDVIEPCSVPMAPLFQPLQLPNHAKLTGPVFGMTHVPDDIDLDDEMRTIHSGDCLVPASYPISSLPSSPLPQQEHQRCLDDLVTLEQQSTETLSLYFARGKALYSKIPSMARSAGLVRLVEGITDVVVRNTHKHRLDALGWSWENLETICLNRPDESSVDHISEPNTEDEGEQAAAIVADSAVEHMESEHLVSTINASPGKQHGGRVANAPLLSAESSHATDMLDNGMPQVYPIPSCKGYKKVSSERWQADLHLVQKPRRSQRIAERMRKAHEADADPESVIGGSTTNLQPEIMPLISRDLPDQLQSNGDGIDHDSDRAMDQAIAKPQGPAQEQAPTQLHPKLAAPKSLQQRKPKRKFDNNKTGPSRKRTKRSKSHGVAAVPPAQRPKESQATPLVLSTPSLPSRYVAERPLPPAGPPKTPKKRIKAKRVDQRESLVRCPTSPLAFACASKAPHSQDLDCDSGKQGVLSEDEVTTVVWKL